MIGIIFLSMLALFFLGAPMSFGILASTVLFLFFQGNFVEITSVTAQVIFASDTYVLIAIPFFILAADLMNESRITDRIFGFAKSVVGHIPGGLGHVNVFASMIFSGMSGSCLADTSGLGKVEIKAMLDGKYDPAFSASVTAASAMIGPIIPPSISMVIGAVVTGTSPGRMLVGGIMPGIMMGFGLMAVVYFLAKSRNYDRLPRESFKIVIKKFIATCPALMTIVIMVGGIITGIFTPTEAAVIACIYALLLSVFYYRSFGFKKLFRIMISTGVNTGALLFILSAASGLGLLATRAQIPQQIIQSVVGITSNPTLVLFLIIGILILMGMVMEDLSLLVIMGPLLTPLVKQMGIDPVQFGVILVLTLMFAMITPPIGMGFYITCNYANVDVIAYSKEILWFFLVLLFVVILMVFFPGIVTTLPNLVFGAPLV